MWRARCYTYPKKKLKKNSHGINVSYEFNYILVTCKKKQQALITIHSITQAESGINKKVKKLNKNKK